MGNVYSSAVLDPVTNKKKQYEALVRAYPEIFRGIENGLNFLTTPLPFICQMVSSGSYADQYTGIAGVESLIKLLSLYHDAVLDNFSEPTLYCGRETPFMKTIKYLLEIVKRSQLFIDLLASDRLTKQQRWNVVIILEFFKAFCRLCLVYAAKGKMLFLPEDPLEDEIISLDNLDPEDSLNDLRAMYIEHGRNAANGVGHFSIHTENLRPNIEQATAEKLKTLGDTLYFLRPFVYAFLLKYKKWPAFFVSLIMDIFSTVCCLMATKTTRERAELIRRSLLYFFYLFRDPIYEDYVKDPIVNLLLRLAKIPLIGVFPQLGVEIMKELTEKYYFYVSGSG